MPTKTLRRAIRADRSRAVIDWHELTPIDWHDGIAYKRDDLFMPFSDVDLGGGKVRQALQLVESRRNEIASEHGATLLTATGVHSPQGLIIARVAAAFDFACTLFVGATTTTRALAAHKMLRSAQALGAEIDDSCGIGYEPALAKTLDRWRAEHGRGYPIRFGMSVDSDRAAIVDSTAEQAANIPDEITTVVIPVGSGITAAGIIEGVRTRRPNVDRIICVQIAGYDRRSKIDAITSHRDYEFVTSTAYAYAKLVQRDVARGFHLDPIYEAKAHEHMMRRLDVPLGRTLFWVVADSGWVR